MLINSVSEFVSSEIQMIKLPHTLLQALLFAMEWLLV